MLELEFYVKLRGELEMEVQDLWGEWKKSGIALAEEYELEINKKEKKILELNKRILYIQKFKENEDYPISIYIITTIKSFLHKNLKEGIIKQIPEDRYDETDQDKWRPYTSDKHISELLSDFQKKNGYEFSVRYLDDGIDKSVYSFIDTNRKSSVIIVDLLALEGRNINIASRFDSKTMANIILPLCSKLPNSVKEYMIDKRREVFWVSERHYTEEDCTFYQPSAGEPRDLSQKLLQVFSQKPRTSNSIQDKNDDRDSFIRNLNPDLQ